MIISLFLHVAALLVIHEAFPMNWFMTPVRTYHVELLRPSLDILDETKGVDLARIKRQEEKLLGITEDTISLDTKDKRYSSYAKAVKDRLMRHWAYPREAEDNLIEGQVLALFSLDRQGRLKAIRLLQPSQHRVLDSESTRAIRAAAPFPPFPGSVTVTKLHIKANFAYRLTARR
ncbi:MAG: energy transducer TonB [Deltaproteobacteria bacterium]|nr:energy transducer TonB [Deltaproteobacteria bacterium]